MVGWVFSRLPENPLKRLHKSETVVRIMNGAFWSVIGTLSARGLNMVSIIIVARIIGSDSFGKLGIIQSTILLFQSIALCGLGLAATKYVSEFRKTDLEKTGRIISFIEKVSVATGGAMALLFFLCSPFIAKNFLAAPEITGLLQISSSMLFLVTFEGTQNGILAGFEEFRIIANLNFVSGLINIPLLVFCTWFYGLSGVVLGMLISTLINCLLFFWASRRRIRLSNIRISRKDSGSEKKIFWMFCLPSVIGGTVFNLGGWFGNVFLVNSPGGYGEMGFFNAANQWFVALLFLPRVLMNVALPIISEQLGNNEGKKSYKIMTGSIKIYLLFVVPVVFILSIASPWIMGLFGNNFKQAWGTLVMTLIASGIVAVQTPAAQVITASGKMWKMMVMNCSWAIVFIATSFFLIKWGSLGLATGRCLAYLFYAGWSFKFAFSIIRTS